MSTHYHLGKIFISHSSADKPFVRGLAERLTREGFQVWLDERDLIVGDPLAKKISQGLSAARVVLVIISKASISSKWLSYELNLATDLMVNGRCRVIPVVIDGSSLPPEVLGLLYADCRRSLDDGLPSILSALRYESRRAAMERGFWAQAEVLLRDVFGATGSESILGEYRNRDYDVVYLPVEDEDGNERVVSYEVVSNYLKSPSPLGEAWLKEYVEATGDIPEGLSLVVTERPPTFSVDSRDRRSDRVGIRAFRWPELDMTYRRVVVADLTGLEDESVQLEVLSAARAALIECARHEMEETQRLRDRYRAAGPATEE